MNKKELTKKIKMEALKLGFSKVGITTAKAEIENYLNLLLFKWSSMIIRLANNTGETNHAKGTVHHP